MSETCRVTRCENLRACRIGESLLIFGIAHTHSTCDHAKVVPSMLTIFPPEFLVVSCRPDGEICGDAEGKESVLGVFIYPENEATVVVHTADGRNELKIDPCIFSLSFLGKEATRDEFVGYSPRSIEEAILSAKAQAGPPPAGTADALLHTTVLESGRLEGGFAGWRHFYVRVRAIWT